MWNISLHHVDTMTPVLQSSLGPIISRAVPRMRPCKDPPDKDILFLADCLPQRLPQSHLGEILQGRVDGVADGLVEDALHPPHKHLQTLDHGNHLVGTRQGLA